MNSRHNLNHRRRRTRRSLRPLLAIIVVPTNAMSRTLLVPKRVVCQPKARDPPRGQAMVARRGAGVLSLALSRQQDVHPRLEESPINNAGRANLATVGGNLIAKIRPPLPREDVIMPSRNRSSLLRLHRLPLRLRKPVTPFLPFNGLLQTSRRLLLPSSP